MQCMVQLMSCELDRQVTGYNYDDTVMLIVL